jgi:hypothetical protein
MLGVGFGYHAADFTGDIRQLSEFAQVCLPGVELLLLDVWLDKMVEDTGCIRAALHQFNHAGQLPVFDAEVELQVIFWHQTDSGDEVGLQAEVRVGLVLYVPPDSFDEWGDDR